MSEDAISRFFEKISTDDALREEFTKAIEGAVVDLAARHGCEFTAEELAQKLAGELTEGDLEAVAAGMATPMANETLSSEMLLAGLTRGVGFQVGGTVASAKGLGGRSVDIYTR
jgi:predicted ribosomally synthesized peptide with nif11-like leader